MAVHVHRADHARGFTQIANEVLRDPRLSLRAKGLLVQLISHEDGWQQSLAYAQTQCLDGKDAIRVAFRELEAAGYATQEAHRDKRGRWVYEYHVFDESQAGVRPETGGFTAAVSPQRYHRVGEPAPLEEPLEEEPLEEEPLEVKTLAPTSGARKRDLAFEALCLIEGATPEELTSPGRGAINRALKEIRLAWKGDPEDLPVEIIKRAEHLVATFPNAQPTAPSLAKHWARLATQPRDFSALGKRAKRTDRIQALMAEAKERRAI